jgi:hypothetical protein
MAYPSDKRGGQFVTPRLQKAGERIAQSNNRSERKARIGP